jgi:two-component system, cell cycle sensor histidine kinase and response regulator CckA
MSDRRLRVLYVDDEEALGILVPLAMDPLGHEVVYHERAAAALEEFRRRPEGFDAVVTDLSMPGISGFDVVREVRAVRPSVPVVVTSGFVGEREKADAAAAGALAMVLKPDTVDELAEALDRVIRGAVGADAA